MDTSDILRIRLRSQLIEGGAATSPREVVSHLLGMQAQDYAGATWAIGLRLPGSAAADVERAIADREIVRTWPMRGTLHFAAAEDARWMTALLSPRVLAGARRRELDLELDAGTFAHACELFASALTGGERLTRPDAMAMLEAAGIATAGQRGYHILWRLAQEGLLVLGPMHGRQQTFALLEEWIPTGRGALDLATPREQLLAHVAARYIAGHGPATLADLARWAGIPMSDARAAIEATAPSFESARHEGELHWFDPRAAEASAASAGPDRAHLLPGFDEYMLGYSSRRHQLGENLEMYGSRVASNGVLAATVVIGGRAVGIWKRTLTARTVSFVVTRFRSLTAGERAALAVEQARYARFVGREPAEE